MIALAAKLAVSSEGQLGLVLVEQSVMVLLVLLLARV